MLPLGEVIASSWKKPPTHPTSSILIPPLQGTCFRHLIQTPQSPQGNELWRFCEDDDLGLVCPGSVVTSSDTQNIAAKQGWHPRCNSILVQTLPLDCCVTLDKPLNLSGLSSSVCQWAGLDNYWGLCPERLPPEPKIDCALSSVPQELFTPAQHLPKPPTTLAAAACVALEPGGCCSRAEGDS